MRWDGLPRHHVPHESRHFLEQQTGTPETEKQTNQKKVKPTKHNLLGQLIVSVGTTRVQKFQLKVGTTFTHQCRQSSQSLAGTQQLSIYDRTRVQMSDYTDMLWKLQFIKGVLQVCVIENLALIWNEAMVISWQARGGWFTQWEHLSQLSRGWGKLLFSCGSLSV